MRRPPVQAGRRAAPGTCSAVQCSGTLSPDAPVPRGLHVLVVEECDPVQVGAAAVVDGEEGGVAGLVALGPDLTTTQ